MNDKAYHLVHANIALALYAFQDPRMDGFFKQIDRINHLATQAPGFIAEPALADTGSIYQEPYILNVTLWQSLQSLKNFVYSGAHANALKNKSAWFKKQALPNYVLYWLPKDTMPTEHEVYAKILHLQKNGPTAEAFNFQQHFSV